MEGEGNSSRLEDVLLQVPHTAQAFLAPYIDVSLHQRRCLEASEVAPISNPPFHMPNGGHCGAISNISATASQQSDKRRFRPHACRFCPKDYVQRYSLVRHMRKVHIRELEEEQSEHEWLANEQYASHQAHLQRLASEVSSKNGMYMGAGSVVHMAVNSTEAVSLDRILESLDQCRQSYHPTSQSMQLQNQRQNNVMPRQNASTTPSELTSVQIEAWQSNPYNRSLQPPHLSWNSGNALQTGQNWESAFSLDGRVALSYQDRPAYHPRFDIGTSQRPRQGHNDTTLCIPCNHARQPLTYPHGAIMPAGYRGNTLQYSWRNRAVEASTLARPVDFFLSNRHWVPQRTYFYNNEPIMLIHNPLVEKYRSPLDYY